MKIPLAHKLRPETFDDIVGQQHLIGKGAPLRALVEADLLPSCILFGPAGTGKTSIAQVIAKHTKSQFHKLNATYATVKDIRQVVKTDENIVIFVDEIHRFSKTQQDVLLPFVESGNVIFIGATTESPFHSVNGPLLSRCHAFELNKLTDAEVCKLLVKGIKHIRLTKADFKIDNDSIKAVIKAANHDGRKAVSILEMASLVSDNITVDIVTSIAPNKYYAFSDNAHFDYASAYQGSIQASDPDAAIYWLAQWLESGEDPRYIARRLLVSAAEDAYSNPICTAVAHAAYTAACEVGRPECDIVMAQATIMIATSERNKTAANAIWQAVKDVRSKADLEIPREMRDSHYPGAKQLGHGQYHDGADMSAYVGIKKRYVKHEHRAAQGQSAETTGD